jgi:hypothetical protein
VHIRILAGVGAWLLGVGTATAGSLLAVSLLGQGIADSPGQQLTTDAVKSALAGEAQETSPAGTHITRPPVPTPSVTRRAASRRRPSVITLAPATPSAAPVVPRPAASPSPPGTSAPAMSPQATSGTVLTSQGGTALAECRSAGAYFVSWSPTQGYEATGVVRGPAATASVVFNSSANSVTMVVSCPGGAGGGTPTASSYIHPSGGGTTDE